MKYIDTDKLIAEIEQISSSEHPIEYEQAEKLAYNRALSEIEDAIISLQQEQPSLPEGLEEAAETYGREHTILPDEYNDGDIPDYEEATATVFKAGAEWMAGQGVTCGGRIMKSSTGETYAESDYVPLDGKCGEKVIVQIRHKV